MSRPRSIGICCSLVTVLALMGTSKPLVAGPWHDFHYNFHLNNCWPLPYVYADRAHVRDTMESQVANGWRRQHLLGDHYFNSETSELTEAGQIKVRWILTQAPEHRRTLFVQRSLNPDVTQARIASVEQAASQVLGPGETPVIQDTHLMAEGHPAADVASTAIRYRDTKPAPQLPAVTNETD